MKPWYWIFPALLGLAGQAAPAAEFPDLPPLSTVEAALADYPAVLAARAGIREGEANRARQVAGTYETNVRVLGQRRTLSETDQAYSEWGVALERPLRLPGKARLDEQLGSQEVSQAQIVYGDAMHEAGRTLLKAWFAWQREVAQTRQWQAQVEVLKEQAAVAAKRVRAGDASGLEKSLAEASLAQAEASLAQSRGRERVAASDLAVRFARIPLPAQPVIAEPQPLTQDRPYWQEQILAHSHELALARAQVQRERLVAARSGADRMPDPTAGIHYASEFGGRERIVGVSVSIPLPGAARAAASDGAQARAEAAASREAGVLRKLEAEIAGTFAVAQSAYDNWHNLRAAAERVDASANLTARAYALGEGGITDVLNARRQALEGRLAATVAQIDAVESRYRLLLDAHQLWPLDGHHDEEAEGVTPVKPMVTN